MTELLQEINWAIFAPLLVIELILKIIALIDWSKAKDTNGPRWMWPFIIIIISTVGPILYFIFGRRQR